MKNKKETIKTIVLILLVLSSIFLSFIITTYRPDYEIFNGRIEQKDKNKQELIKESLSVATPDIITKVMAETREEEVVQNAITKVATVEGIKNKQIIKDILTTIADDSSVETRVRNKSVAELKNSASEKIIMEYSALLDVSIVKPIFFEEDNTNVSLGFNRVLIVKDKPNTICLYKEGGDSYLQVDLKVDIYNKIIDIFDKNKENYSKYSLNNKFIYLEDYKENYYIDEYSVEEIDINKLGHQIFLGSNNIRTSGENELTDGYAILRKSGDMILYINPSNEDAKPTTELITTTNAINFLATTYLNDTNYKIIEATENYTVFQELYKDSLAIGKNGLSRINVQSNANGIYQAAMSKRQSGTLLSSKKMEDYSVARPEYIINYLYSYTDLKAIEDLVLGYEKTYDIKNNSFIYTPTWYIKYKGKYQSFSDIKNMVEGKVI